VIALLFALVLLSAVALSVVAYANYTHRGFPLPGSPVLNERVDRWHDSVSAKVGGPLENTAVSGALISHSVVLTPEKDVEWRQSFLRAERRVVAKLPAAARRRIEEHVPALASRPDDAAEGQTGSPVVV
jgi:hypothetical protein